MSKSDDIRDEILKERAVLVRDIVEYHMVHMPIRELLDCFSDDHYGDLAWSHVMNRARLNMSKHYDKTFTLEELRATWAGIRGARASRSS